MNYSALPSSALETLLDLGLSQDQDPVVVCTDFMNLYLRTGYEVLALPDTKLLVRAGRARAEPAFAEKGRPVTPNAPAVTSLPMKH